MLWGANEKGRNQEEVKLKHGLVSSMLPNFSTFHIPRIKTRELRLALTQSVKATRRLLSPAYWTVTLQLFLFFWFSQIWEKWLLGIKFSWTSVSVKKDK